MTPPIQRVYLVAWWFAPSGGMERHLTDLALALTRRRVEVVVFSQLPLPLSSIYARELGAAGIAIIAPGWFAGALLRAEERNSTWRTVLSMARAGRSLSTTLPLQALCRSADDAPPDIVHVHGCRLGQDWVLQWASARGYPTVYTEHLTITDWGGPFDEDAPWIVDGAADVIACVSEASRADLMTHMPRPRPIAVTRHIIRAAAVADPFIAARPRSELLCVARLEPYKAIHVLLESVALLHARAVPLHLGIAGDGSLRSALQSQCASLGLNDVVTFHGNLNASAVSELWENAGIGVLSSHTEGLPLALVEAMAHGKAIAATRAGGIPEIITDEENGLLVEPGDSKALAAAIHRLIRDEALARRLGRAARATFEAGGWSETAVTETTLSLTGRRVPFVSPARKSTRHPTPQPGFKIKRIAPPVRFAASILRYGAWAVTAIWKIAWPIRP